MKLIIRSICGVCGPLSIFIGASLQALKVLLIEQLTNFYTMLFMETQAFFGQSLCAARLSVIC